MTDKLRLTADKREIKGFAKLPSVTPFIPQPLSEMLCLRKAHRKNNKEED